MGRTQAGVRTGSSSTSSPDSRRSFSGMKLRTGGTRSKLYGGGGDVVAHSSVLPCHGSLPAISPWFQLRTMLIRKISTEIAMRNDEMVMIRLVVAHEALAYVAIRRGMPSRPSVCMMRKVPLKPMKVVQKCHSPSFLSSSLPVIFGNQ